MIIFYQKSTGNIIGTIQGRVNTDDHRKMWIQPADIPAEDIDKWEVGLKESKESVEIPITENRVVDFNTYKVDNVKVGTRIVERVKELVYDHPQRKLLEAFESGEKDTKDYIITVSKPDKFRFRKK